MSLKHVLLQLALIEVLYWSSVEGLPNIDCNTLSPIDAEKSLQRGPPPYEVDVSNLKDSDRKLSYLPGKTYKCEYCKANIGRNAALFLGILSQDSSINSGGSRISQRGLQFGISFLLHEPEH